MPQWRAGTALAQAPVQWRDPSPHRVGFVYVEDGIRLETLDWGGTGRPLVLLTGSGLSGHIYDELAPKLTAFSRVYAITRRGHGNSSKPAGGYDEQRLADDVLRVLDKLEIRSPVLVGYSMAGMVVDGSVLEEPPAESTPHLRMNTPGECGPSLVLNGRFRFRDQMRPDRLPFHGYPLGRRG